MVWFEDTVKTRGLSVDPLDQLTNSYSASGVASFAFLTPAFSVLLANIILDEAIELSVFLSLSLVSIGLYLINRTHS